MPFHFGARSSQPLPFALTGALATGWLLRALRRGTTDALLALLLAAPALQIVRELLAHAAWYDSPDEYTPAML